MLRIEVLETHYVDDYYKLYYIPIIIKSFHIGFKPCFKKE